MTYRHYNQGHSEIYEIHTAGLEEDSAVHPHFLGRFGPNQPKEEGIQRESKQWHQTGIPGMQSREYEGHFCE